MNLPKWYDAGFEPHNFENLTAGRYANIDQMLFNKAITAEPKLASLLVDDVLQRPQALAMLNTVMKTWLMQSQQKNITRQNDKCRRCTGGCYLKARSIR
ncbi:Uncharacterised protein [Actinobacillus equuli]|nr:Uncharacterised protein [Actinobacillus equuli]